MGRIVENSKKTSHISQRWRMKTNRVYMRIPGAMLRHTASLDRASFTEYFVTKIYIDCEKSKKKGRKMSSLKTNTTHGSRILPMQR